MGWHSPPPTRGAACPALKRAYAAPFGSPWEAAGPCRPPQGAPKRLRAASAPNYIPIQGGRHLSAGALSENARCRPHASLSPPATARRGEPVDACDAAAQRVDRRPRCGGAASRSTPAMRRRELAPPLDARTRRSYTVRVGRAGHGVPQRAWRRHRADEEDQRHLAHPLDISHPHPARRISARPASALHATATPSDAVCKGAPSERMRRATRLR